MQNNKSLKILAFISVIVLSIISCIKVVHEPDFWWQIRTGQWIIENNEVPKVDFLSYTFHGEPWLNVKWGSEVLMALINDSVGVKWLFLLQVLCILLIFYFSVKTVNVFQRKLGVENTVVGLLMSFVLMLFIINYRMNARPEIFSHLFLSMSFYYLIKYEKSKSNWLYILIPIQVLWVNMHEAYGVGIVLVLIFVFANWFEYYFIKSKTVKPFKLSLVGILMILSTMINPNGAKMILHLFNIYNQLSENKFTTELVDAGNPLYWSYQSYLMVVIFVIVLWGVLKKRDKQAVIIISIISKTGISYFVMLIAFFYLSLNSFRNIPFFIIVSLPLMACFFDVRLNKLKNKALLTVIIFNVFFGIYIISNKFYENWLPKENFGIGINKETTPIKAAEFIKKNNIEGKGFVDYLSSSYFLYSLQPNYKSYIDLRDLDVLNTVFFENVYTVYQAPTKPVEANLNLWDYFNNVDDFNYVVLLNSTIFNNLNYHLRHVDERYKLVYFDELNLVYLRDNSNNEELISKFKIL